MYDPSHEENAHVIGGLELGGNPGIASTTFQAQPRFNFDVSGYVSPRALGFSVYDNTWQLAAYELGSTLNFGVIFPIHCREAQPFDISLDDVEFQVPDVDPGA